MKDIYFYVADNDMKQLLEGLLSKLFPDKKLNEFCDIYIEPQRDAGVYNKASNFLRNFSRQYHYVMVFLDREGSGQEKKTCEEIEQKIEKDLIYNGWKEGNVKAIVFDPELEVWLWANAQFIAKILGWNNYQELKERLISAGFWEAEKAKPKRPKESMKFALREKKIPCSSSIFKQIALSITPEIFSKCQDHSFQKFMKTLEQWLGMNWKKN